jgi:hypothetical protein
MPDIVNNVQTMSLNHTKSYEEDRSAIKLESTPGYNSQCSENYAQHNDHFHFDPLKQNSTVDMSAIVDPIIINYQLLSMHQKTPINGNENADSLLNDIDMLS